ncbi:MAG: LysR family transcriptional regulator [Sphingobium sp.]|nr:LysR family transcriptional regulator [Sphingobium sp.]
MSAITIRQLEIFVQIVELGSFRRSAEQIGISQVTISDHIQSLEQQLGYRLFERRPGAPAQVTPAGQKIYTRALRILSELSAMEWEFSADRKGAARRRLTMATPDFVIRDLQGKLDQFRNDNPQINMNICLEALSYEDISQRLNNNIIDIAYILAVDDPGLFPSQFISYEPLAIYTSPNHPLAQKTEVSTTDLMDYRTIRLGPHGHARAAVDEAMARCGLGQIETALESDGYGLVLNALQQTNCFACMYAGKPGEQLPHNHFIRLPINFPLPPLQLREAFSARGAQDPAILNLSQMVREWVAQPQ